MNQFYYVDKGKQLGPITEQELQSKVQTKELTPDIKVWKEGMTDWIEFSKLNAQETPSASQEKETKEITEPKDLKAVLTGSVLACIFCLLNPFAGFALVYALQAKNAYNDNREQDMAEKIRLCKKMIFLAIALSILIYSTAAALYLGVIQLPSALQSTF